MGGLSELAPAKINLSLLVTGRRADGYHLLDSVVVFGPACDVLHAGPGRGLRLSVQGPFAAGLSDGPDNLVLRAARLLAERAGVAPDASLVLEKHLPVASGIGGGSADAAAAVRVLSRLWNVQLADDALAALALQLGADVPVCLACEPARMTGVGEVLTTLPQLPACGLLLANPGVALATADVFRARTAPFSMPAALPTAWGDASALAATLAGLGNDLEAAAVQVCPVVADVLMAVRAAPGCLLARMSGSGATCFGLFAGVVAAERAADLLPGSWWRAAGGLYEPPGGALLTRAVGWGVAKR